MTEISIPDFALVALIGPTGSGKSTLCQAHFKPSEVVSSDACRALVADDETDQSATPDAFDLVHHTAGLRLKNRRLTVIDSTAVKPEDRAKLVALGRKWHAPLVALVLDIDPELCHRRNEDRPLRQFPAHVPRNHSRALRRGLRGIRKEGFSTIHIMKTPEEVAALKITRAPLWTDRRAERGPFDVIGDVHGCFDELCALLNDLGYRLSLAEEPEALHAAAHPQGRRAIFVGDLCDRGPKNVEVLRLVMGMVRDETALCVIGNHDFKLSKWLRGQKVTLNHGLDLTVAELEARSEAFRGQVREFIYNLRSHAWLDEGRLVVAHAGLKEEMHGRGSGPLRQFAMFGETTGEIDEFGLPVRLNWARDYRGEAAVIHGHTPTRRAEWLNNTLCIDTGCVFGGALTALRWPEKALVSVPAAREYATPAKPLDHAESALGFTAQQEADQLLFFDELIGRRRIVTRSGVAVVIPEAHAAAALEVMSRFAIDPRWLIYLPPTMAPAPTAPEGPYLEHPRQALDYFAEEGVETLVAEEKHMGSRALAVVARDVDAARARFGVADGKQGVIYTRTGRPFFNDPEREAALVARIAGAATKAGLWDALSTDWMLLDAELMPWSAKAQALLRHQYGPTATAAAASAEALSEALGDAGALAEHADMQAFLDRGARRRDAAERFERVIKGYCWEAEDLEALRFAPFHLLAVEGRVFDSEPHTWHMRQIETLAAGDPVLQPTIWRQIKTGDATAEADLVAWWTRHTEAGGEGMVLKPLAFRPEGRAQPAMKVRGRDYLRIIYGPDYDAPEAVEKLRRRGLRRKWSLALREFALGLEGLHRFVERAPLMRVHECALGVLALESEPVDPRL